MVCIIFWIRLTKTKAYISANRPQYRRWITAIVIDISLLIILTVWFVFPTVRFRAIVAMTVLVPILIFFAKTITLSIKYTVLCILTVCTYIPLMILYLR